jgi:small basic protein (TIGR04137 family)
MSIDRSLKLKGALVRHRNVLTRAERVDVLKDEERWNEGDPVTGLPKVAHRKSAAGKKAKAEAAAEAAAAGAAAPGARGSPQQHRRLRHWPATACCKRACQGAAKDKSDPLARGMIAGWRGMSLFKKEHAERVRMFCPWGAL